MLKKAILLTAFAVSLTITAFAEQVLGNREFKYTVHSAKLVTHLGDVQPAEGSEYLIVNLTAKNVDGQKHFFGGLFNGQFSVSHNGYQYDVDGGAGLAFGSPRGIYTGIEEFTPLQSHTMTVAFTVPTEIASGTWTVKTPTDETFDVTVN